MGVLDIVSGLAKAGGQAYEGYGQDQQIKVRDALASAKAAEEARRNAVLNQVALAGINPDVQRSLAGAKVEGETPGLVNRMKLTAPIEVAKSIDTAKGTAPIEQATHAANRQFDILHPEHHFTTTQVGGDPNVPGSGDVVAFDTSTGQRGGTVGTAKPSGKSTVSPVQQAQREDRLQQNFQQDPAVKQAGVIANAVAQLKASAAQNTPQGDLNMIYGIVKLRDPNSAVREGEIDLQRAARSLGTFVTAAWNKAASGHTLTEQERADIMRLVDQTVDEQGKLVAPVQKRFGEQARQFGVDSSFVAPDPFAGVKKRPPGFVP